MQVCWYFGDKVENFDPAETHKHHEDVELLSGTETVQDESVEPQHAVTLIPPVVGLTLHRTGSLLRPHQPLPVAKRANGWIT